MGMVWGQRAGYEKVRGRHAVLTTKENLVRHYFFFFNVDFYWLFKDFAHAFL